MSIILQNGYYARPVQMGDLERAVDLFNTFTRWQVGAGQSSIEHVRAEWETGMLNLERDTMAVFTADDCPVGYVEFWDINKLHVRPFGWSAVHPDHFGRGIGTFLLNWLLERGRNNVHLAPSDARVILQTNTEARQQDAQELLTRMGFQHVRSSYTMCIPFDTPPRQPAIPDGITIRPFSGDSEMREAIRATYDSFQDHYGFVKQNFDDYYEVQMKWVESNPHYDPSLWFIALDGAEIAGISLCAPHTDEDPSMGWVDKLGVRRPWRKHGLGLALLQHSFHELYKRGCKRVGLGVDASNLTGAVKLYERAGMSVLYKYNLYEYELRPGKNYMTQELSE